ncbi:hypothetical protein ZIOFF_050488 [Zingiber officinale]|uniref:Uncharacterized protein n=1 Tax=Zingiber officinale TaxID=94328 RepID=A0A8J5KM09_ZINOF|nr:hypothetical protein ZIOFF_050488 [Zingiber officinale]
MATDETVRLPLPGRVAIVTGASRGISRAISLHLTSLGARLVLCYASNAAQADLLAAQINSSSSTSPRAPLPLPPLPPPPLNDCTALYLF